MKEISVGYNTVDESKIENFARIEIFCASIAAFTVTADNLMDYSGLELLLPIGSFLIFIANILSLVLYKKFVKKYKTKFEMFLQGLAGLTCYLTSANYFFMGGTIRMTIIYLFLGSVFLFIIPLLIIKSKNKRRIIIGEYGLLFDNKLVTNKTINWQNVEYLIINEDSFEVKIINKKSKKYYVTNSTAEEISIFMKVLQSKMSEFELASN